MILGRLVAPQILRRVCSDALQRGSRNFAFFYGGDTGLIYYCNGTFDTVYVSVKLSIIVVYTFEKRPK